MGLGWGQRAGKEEKAAAAKELERGRIGGVRMRRAGKSNREDGDGMSPEGAGNEEEVRVEDP